MLYVFCVECRDKMTRDKRYNAYSVVATHGKCPRVAFAFARQPWAIKRTTPTALHGEHICNEGKFHWEFTIIPTALHRYNIRNGGGIHWNVSTFCHLFIRILSLIV